MAASGIPARCMLSRYKVPSVVSRTPTRYSSKPWRVGQLCSLAPRCHLPTMAGGVALALEQLTQGHFAGLEGVRRAPDDDGAETRTQRIAPGHERRARGRASRLHQVLRQPQPLAGELVDARGRHAPDLARAIGADVAVADVVGQHDDDVRSVLGMRWARDGDQEQKYPHAFHISSSSVEFPCTCATHETLPITVLERTGPESRPNRWLFVQRLGVLDEDLASRIPDPEVRRRIEHRVFLLRVK